MLAILLAAAGFFTVAEVDSRAMFADPEGKPFYLRGCGTVDKVFGQAPELLKRCGFNAIAQPAAEMVGKGFAWTYNFNVGRRFMEKGPEYVRKNPQGHGFPNVNHPEFEQYVKSFVARFVAGKRDDPTLLGYFIDNELAFDMAGDEEIRRYFDITSKAIRKADPNHMLLGCRFMGGKITSNAVAWEECGRVCDVVSVNIYPKLDLYRRRIYVHDVYFGADGKEIEVVDLLPKLSARCRRPVIVTEWSFPSLDTPHANLVGGGCRVDTQCERAEASALFVRQLYSVKCLPGYIYFRWFDCDSWSKERTNYGLVSDEGVPYMPLVEAFEEVQGRFDKYFGLLPPPRREWPRLPRSFKDLAAEAGLAGDAPQWPDRVSFPREQFDAYPIAGRRVIALAAKPGKRPRAYMHVEGTPLKDPQRWLMRYKPWPNDACFMDDGTYYGFAAPPQSDYSSVKFYVTKKGKVNSDIRMRNGEGCFGFLLWGRGGRKEYERDLARLRRDWERLAGECPKLEHGTKPIGSFRKGAVSDVIKRSLAEEGAARLDRFESAFDKVEAAMGVYPKGSLQHERTRTRLEMARRLVGEVRRQLKSPGEDGFGFAGLGMADLEEFEKSFGEELANWRRNPDNPEAKAQIFRAADFGVKADGATDDAPALARALAAIKALGGKPSILELGAGTILVCEKTVERKKLVGRHSLGPVEAPTTKLEGQILVSEIDNLLIRGEGADRTRIVFGNYNATGLNLLNCLNTTVRGVELDWREAPFAEGVVVKCDRARKVVELKENPLALKVTDPRFLKGSRRLVCGWFDPEGKVVERPFLFTRGKARRLAGGTVELELDGEKMPEIAAGSTIAVPDRAPYLTAACVYSSFCTFDGVRIRSARSSAFSSTRTHNEAVWRCTIRPRDGLKLSTNADGFYCSRGSFIGKCDFSGMNDDGVNPHGNAAKVKSRIGERTLVHLRSGTTRPGDLYQFVRSPSGQTLQLNRLVSAEPVVIGGRTYVRSTFAEPLPEDLRTEEGEHFADLVFVPQADGTGFVALSNSFSRIRNNAMVVQCPNALVEGNRAEGVLKGLHLCALIYGGWCEGSAPYNAVVRDNVFQDVRIGISTGVLMHKGSPAECAPLEGVEMTGNTVRRAAETAAEFRNLSHAAIVGNQFCRAPQPVAFNRCKDVYMRPAPRMPPAESAVSPDGRNRIVYDGGRITVMRDGKILFGPQRIELLLDRGEAKVELVARNDGVAYRFVTGEQGELTVKDEVCELVFPSPDTEIWTGYNWCDNPRDPKQDKLQHGCASIYTKATPSTFVPDGRRIAYLPLTVKFEDGTTVLFSESDLRDYAGMHLKRDSGDDRRLYGVFGKFPVREKEWVAPRNYRRVKEREDFIVKTSAARAFPWRVFAVADRPIGIAEQRLVHDLAAPAKGDFSWVEASATAWEWWNKWHLEGVPFKSGVNTETYKHYIDFAAEYSLKWMLVDEGWKKGDDLYSTVPGFDLDAIVEYARKRNVRLMLWTAWRALDGRQEEYFSHFAARGVKGFKIDFMERDDAAMMRFLERTLEVAAKYRLCIDLHGSGKPTGLEKTYPNLIGIEGVHGLELMKLSFAKNDDFPAHDCQVVFTRAPLGMVDYTPGAMMNRRLCDWKPDDAYPASQGTRVHQLALYTLFPVPFQTLCDSPSRYRKNPECTRFIAEVPTVWDEVKGLDGEIGKFAAVARRKGGEWWVGAITDWSKREVAIDTSFLGKGRWRVEIFADADDAEAFPEHWRRTLAEIDAGAKLLARMAPGGGWTARFTPVGKPGLFVEAENFDDVGGWSVDCQHSLEMGSPYLIAHGIGRAVGPAKTTIDAGKGGKYRLWVRTRNWNAPWSKVAAGRFKVAVNGAECETVFGVGPSQWGWADGGEVELAAGRNTLSLIDLTGFDARVDALALMPDGQCPEELRERLSAAAKAIVPKEVSADLVVAGGGVAGITAALAAARSGLKVALVQDRPVLGGNNSSEVRVHMGGHLQCGKYPHLGDIVAEISPDEGGNARAPSVYEDGRKLAIVQAETNIALYLNTKVDAVFKEGGRISALGAADVKSGRRTRFSAPLFVDATGDGTVGYLAGADFRVGRESRGETGEKSAPEKADRLTMGASCQWRAVRTGKGETFPSEEWMLAFDDGNATAGMKGDWNWETGLGRDQIAEAERIRDYGMLVAYSNWSFVKNRSRRKGEFSDARLDWVASVAGKRESRRLLGDVVMTETDIVEAREYHDGTCLASWSIDLHYPKSEAETGFKGESFRSRCDQRRIALYPIPLGCLYSRNVGNLFMAGRNISVSHIALGTVRVMRTTGMMGEVVGLAASVCKELGCLPRDVREKHFGRLDEKMRRGAGAGNVHSRQQYNVHPNLGLDAKDPASVKRSRSRGWLDVDYFRGLTASEQGVLSNRHIRVRADGKGFAAFRAGESEPFAAWSHAPEGLDMAVRLDENHPFVYVDIAPCAVKGERIAGVVELPELSLGKFSSKVVRQGSAGLGAVDGGEPSAGYLAVAEPFSRRGIVAGWLTNFRAAGAFATRTGQDGGRVLVRPIADYGRMLVRSDRQVPYDTFVVGVFDDCRLGLEAYAAAVADRFAIRLKPNRTGYCTWCSDRYGAADKSVFPGGCGAGTEASMREYAALAAEKLSPWGFEFIQIDDNWQGGRIKNGPAKDWSKTTPAGGYPNGFEGFVENLSRYGFAPGLWFIPFGADAGDGAWKRCEQFCVKSAVDVPSKIGKDAFVEPVVLPRRKGDMIRTVWGGECLDMTHPTAQARLAATVRRFTHEWGFRYLKCDGLFTGFGCDIYGGYGWKDVNFGNAVFSDPEASNVSAFRLGLETIRKAATPDTFVLGCNLGTIRAMVPSYGLVDGMRIGNDNGPIDADPMRYLEGPKAGSMRYFLNGRVWRADPDSTYVRASLPVGRARLAASWTAITDSLFEVGDWLGDLPDERIEILKRTMAHHGSVNVRPIDYFENEFPNGWILDGGEKKVLMFCNWSTNETLKIDWPFDYVGLDVGKEYVGWDFWGERPFGPVKGRIELSVPPDDCVIVSCCEKGDGEQIVSTSLHVASPVYGVEGKKVLSVAGEPLTVRTYSVKSGFCTHTLPPGFGHMREVPGF